MKIIKPYHEILTPIDGVWMLKHIELWSYLLQERT